MSADDFEFRSYDQPKEQELDKLRSQSKNGYRIACVLMISQIVLLIVIGILPAGTFNFIFIPLLIITFGLMMVGLVILALYGTAGNLLIKVYTILQRLGPPEPVIGKRVVFKEYNDVYIIARGFGGMLYFVAFREQQAVVTDSKMRVPSTFWAWEREVVIDNLKLFRREGTFSVPTERNEFISGEGIVYADTFVPSMSHIRVPEFTKDEMLAIIEKLNEDVRSPSLEK